MSKNRRIRDTSASPRAAAPNGRRREVLGVLGLGAAIFLLVAMVSLQAGRLVMGPFGRSTASLFYGLVGVCGYALIALAIVAAVRTLIERTPIAPAAVVVGSVIGVVALAVVVHLAAAGYRVAGHGPGGAIGEHLAEILRAVVGTAGTALLALVGLVVAVVVATPLRMRDVLHAFGHAARAVGVSLGRAVLAFGRFWREVLRAMLPAPDRDDDDDDAADDVDDDKHDKPAIEIDERDVLEVGADEAEAEPAIIGRPARKKKRAELEILGGDADAAAAAGAKTVPTLEVVEPAADAPNADVRAQNADVRAASVRAARDRR